MAFLSGAIAAVGSSVVKVPIAVCVRSVQAGVYVNVFHAARSITKAAGPRGLFTVSRQHAGVHTDTHVLGHAVLQLQRQGQRGSLACASPGECLHV